MDESKSNPPVSPLEQELVRRARNGDDQAFSQLVDLHASGLYRVVRRIASDAGEAQALVQEAFLRVWANLGRYREDRPFFPYLVTVAINLGRDQWRKERLLDFGGLDVLENHFPDQAPPIEERLVEAEALDALGKAVADLPPAYRAVIALRYDAGLSYQETAQALGLPLNTVRTHLRRAKAYLRQMLESQEQSHG